MTYSEIILVVVLFLMLAGYLYLREYADIGRIKRSAKARGWRNIRVRFRWRKGVFDHIQERSYHVKYRDGNNSRKEARCVVDENDQVFWRDEEPQETDAGKWH
jgi:hypothetical protein